MARQIDTLVVGGGVTGTAAAWQLAQRGAEVVVLEQRAEHPAPPGTGVLAGSAEPTASFVSTAHADPSLLSLLTDSLRLWSDLESSAGRAVLGRVGGLRHGADPALDDIAVTAPRFGFDTELLAPAEAERRTPGFRADGRVLASAGTAAVDLGRAVEALRAAARAAGAEFRFGTTVTRIRVLGDDRALVETARTRPSDASEGAAPGGSASPGGVTVEEWECRNLVVTLGAWTPKLLGAVLVLPRLIVTRTETALVRSAHAGLAPPLPVIEHRQSLRDPRFGSWLSPLLVAVPVEGGSEVSWLGGGSVPGRPIRDPDARPPRASRRPAAAFARYVRDWLPGLDPDAAAGLGTDEAAEAADEAQGPHGLRHSLHTVARDGQFVVDRVGPVSVAVGFSDHGVTLAPAVGALLAELGEGVRAPAPFSLRPERRSAAAAHQPAS